MSRRNSTAVAPFVPETKEEMVAKLTGIVRRLQEVIKQASASGRTITMSVQVNPAFGPVLTVEGLSHYGEILIWAINQTSPPQEWESRIMLETTLNEVEAEFKELEQARTRRNNLIDKLNTMLSAEERAMIQVPAVEAPINSRWNSSNC